MKNIVYITDINSYIIEGGENGIYYFYGKIDSLNKFFFNTFWINFFFKYLLNKFILYKFFFNLKTNIDGFVFVLLWYIISIIELAFSIYIYIYYVLCFFYPELMLI